MIALDGADDPAELPGASFVVDTTPSGPPARRTVQFGTCGLVDERLRGRRLSEDAAVDRGLTVTGADRVLASIEGRAVWLKRPGGHACHDVVAVAPSELAPGEYLRDRLDPGRFLELLPLVHFLREVTASDAWQSPPTGAALIVDNPNLHWHRYGYLRYPEIVAHGRRHHYHLAVAMVPIDGWYAHSRTVALFRDSTDVLSLCVHGNDHRLDELGRPSTAAEARPIIAQSCRRIAAFERRTGLQFSRVMVPPFESCSAAAMDALLEFGFEGLTQTRPHVWMPLGPGHSPYASTDPEHTLSGWHRAEMMDDGLPVMIRRGFHEHDAMVLRSFLDQPLLLYGHVEDLADGFDALKSAADAVNSFPSVQWSSLSEIASSNFQFLRRDDVLEIRPFARRIRVEVEPDVTRILVRPEGASGFEHGMRIRSSSTTWTVEGQVIELAPGRSQSEELEISFHPAHTAPVAHRLPFSAFALARRAVAEVRDRITPVVGRGIAVALVADVLPVLA